MSETKTVWHPFPKEKPPEPLTRYLVPLHTVLAVFGQRPLFGNRKPGGKKGETFWMVFFKTKNPV